LADYPAVVARRKANEAIVQKIEAQRRANQDRNSTLTEKGDAMTTETVEQDKPVVDVATAEAEVRALEQELGRLAGSRILAEQRQRAAVGLVEALRVKRRELVAAHVGEDAADVPGLASLDHQVAEAERLARAVDDAVAAIAVKQADVEAQRVRGIYLTRPARAARDKTSIRASFLRFASRARRRRLASVTTSPWPASAKARVTSLTVVSHDCPASRHRAKSRNAGPRTQVSSRCPRGCFGGCSGVVSRKYFLR
jgi:hypothetical protein